MSDPAAVLAGERASLRVLAERVIELTNRSTLLPEQVPPIDREIGAAVPTLARACVELLDENERLMRALEVVLLP